MKTRAKRFSVLVVTVAVVLTTFGCSTYHTTYTNLHPVGDDPVADHSARLVEAGFFHGWEHFWIFGLLPFENRVAARSRCEENTVEQVRTYQSGLQFLLANLQGAFIYVNVWSPYTAKVDCALPLGNSADVSRRTQSVDTSGPFASPTAPNSTNRKTS